MSRRACSLSDRSAGCCDEADGPVWALGFVREGDILTVWKLYRLGSSPTHLIDTVNALGRALTRGRPLDAAWYSSPKNAAIYTYGNIFPHLLRNYSEVAQQTILARKRA
jgi:hypothetical protein